MLRFRPLQINKALKLDYDFYCDAYGFRPLQINKALKPQIGLFLRFEVLTKLNALAGRS